MKLIKLKCTFCRKEFLKPRGRVNEAKKFSWKPYCSLKCQGLTRTKLAKSKQVALKCENPACNKIFKRVPHEVSHSNHHFCSRSCANIVIGARRRKIKICLKCGREFSGRKVFCSFKCHIDYLRKPKFQKRREVLNEIKDFYSSYGRIPLKREGPGLAWRAQKVFGSWNKALEALNFKTNPIKFSKKFIAKDGHICDSFAEKIIDDWLYSRNIEHQRSISYPNTLYTADFLIKGKFVEFFGLNGELKEYDKTMKLKEKLAKKYKLKLIKIYPKDLFPVNHLSEIIKN